MESDLSILDRIFYRPAYHNVPGWTRTPIWELVERLVRSPLWWRCVKQGERNALIIRVCNRTSKPMLWGIS